LQSTAQELSSASRNVFPEAVALSSLRESEEEGMGLESKMPTITRVTTDRLFSKKVFFLKLPVTFHASVLEETASTLHWGNWMSAKKSRKCTQRL